MIQKLKRFLSSLRGRIFSSHLLVLFTGMGALVAGVYFVAPAFFAQHMRFMMRGPGMGRMMQQYGVPGSGPRTGLSPNNPAVTALNDAIGEMLTTAFLASLRSALWVSATLGVLVALTASIYVSSRVTRRMREISRAASHIAAGHFYERLDEAGQDELAELATDFNRMAQSLENAEERRTQLIGDVAHEMRTPLTTVEGYMEALIDGVMPPTLNTFQLVQKEAARLRRLVTDLQELSRAEAGTIPITLQALDPVQCVKQATSRMEPLYRDKGIILESVVPDSLPLVRADIDRTLQVLLNLLGNALNYTPTGGKVVIGAAPLADEVDFVVSDSGIGIAAEDLPHIFERFFRADRSRNRQTGGSGLGLTISRHLVLAQKGRIWATSEGVDQGAQFHFTLPVWTN